MQRHIFIPEGVCTTEITFEIEDGVLKHVEFSDGCSGNLQAIARLVEGMRVEEVVRKLKGIDCEEKGTSCTDQLARALEQAVRSKETRV